MPTKNDESDRRPSEWSDEHVKDQDKAFNTIYNEDATEEEKQAARDEYIEKWGR